MSWSMLWPPASTTATRAPAWVSVYAIMLPPAPDPTITTSNISVIVFYRPRCTLLTRAVRFFVLQRAGNGFELYVAILHAGISPYAETDRPLHAAVGVY